MKDAFSKFNGILQNKIDIEKEKRKTERLRLPEYLLMPRSSSMLSAKNFILIKNGRLDLKEALKSPIDKEKQEYMQLMKAQSAAKLPAINSDAEDDSDDEKPEVLFSEESKITSNAQKSVKINPKAEITNVKTITKSGTLKSSTIKSTSLSRSYSRKSTLRKSKSKSKKKKKKKNNLFFDLRRYAYSNGCNKIKDFLLGLPGNTEPYSQPGAEEFMDAVKKNKIREVEEVLKRRPQLLLTHDFLNQTPYHWACKYGHHELLEIMMKYGKCYNLRDIYRRTPIYFAAKYGRKECVKLLLDNGVDPFFADINGRYPNQVSYTREIKAMINRHPVVDQIYKRFDNIFSKIQESLARDKNPPKSNEPIYSDGESEKTMSKKATIKDTNKVDNSNNANNETSNTTKAPDSSKDKPNDTNNNQSNPEQTTNNETNANTTGNK